MNARRSSSLKLGKCNLYLSSIRQVVVFVVVLFSLVSIFWYLYAKSLNMKYYNDSQILRYAVHAVDLRLEDVDAKKLIIHETSKMRESISRKINALICSNVIIFICATSILLKDGRGKLKGKYYRPNWCQDISESGVELAESALGNRYCFRGREIDWDTGLYYFRARWCDPATGRWLSKSRLELVVGWTSMFFAIAIRLIKQIRRERAGYLALLLLF